MVAGGWANVFLGMEVGRLGEGYGDGFFLGLGSLSWVFGWVLGEGCGWSGEC